MASETSEPPAGFVASDGFDGGRSDPPSESDVTVHDDPLEGNPYDLDDAELHADWYAEQESAAEWGLI